MISLIGRLNRRSGFTLLELVIVVVIIGTLVLLSAPMFARTYNDLALQNSASNVSRTIFLAQQTAVSEKKTVKMVIDKKKKAYWLLGEDRSDAKIVFKNIKGSFGRVFILPSGTDIECANDGIFFYPDGSSDAILIKLKNRYENIYTVTNQGSAGYAKVIKGDVE